MASSPAARTGRVAAHAFLSALPGTTQVGRYCAARPATPTGLEAALGTPPRAEDAPPASATRQRQVAGPGVTAGAAALPGAHGRVSSCAPLATESLVSLKPPACLLGLNPLSSPGPGPGPPN